MAARARVRMTRAKGAPDSAANRNTVILDWEEIRLHEHDEWSTGREAAKNDVVIERWYFSRRAVVLVGHGSTVRVEIFNKSGAYLIGRDGTETHLPGPRLEGEESPIVRHHIFELTAPTTLVLPGGSYDDRRDPATGELYTYTSLPREPREDITLELDPLEPTESGSIPFKTTNPVEILTADAIEPEWFDEEVPQSTTLVPPPGQDQQLVLDSMDNDIRRTLTAYFARYIVGTPEAGISSRHEVGVMLSDDPTDPEAVGRATGNAERRRDRWMEKNGIGQASGEGPKVVQLRDWLRDGNLWDSFDASVARGFLSKLD